LKLDGKLFWLTLCPALVALGAGCSGINASQSVSPASFFLPGLGQAAPLQVPVKVVPFTDRESVRLVAQVN
jgi:hypothetical protein